MYTGLGKQTLGGHKQNPGTPGCRRKEQWLHKRLNQTCPSVSRSLWQKCGLAVAYCRVRGTEYSSECVGSVARGLHYLNSVSSIAQSCPTLQPHGLQHTRPPCPSPTPRVHPNSRPLGWWCQTNISSSVVPFSSCLQPFPASGYFQMSQLFTSGGQSTGVSASTSVLPMNTQNWFPLAWTATFPCSPRDSRVFSNTTVQKHQFFGSAFFIVQLSHPYMTTGKTIAMTTHTFIGKLP